jgi:hypothetical protein
VALYTSCVLGLRPFALSIKSYFIKKKKRTIFTHLQ